MNSSDEQKEQANTTWLSKRTLLWAIFLFILLSSIAFLLFMWNRPIKLFSTDYVLDNALWGNLGDFIGGVGGPILAFCGVIITCFIFKEQKAQTSIINKEQNKITQRSINAQENQSEIQRFNALFFELINLHRDQITELNNLPVIGISSTIFTKIRFIDKCAMDLKDNCNFTTLSYAKRHTATTNQYLRLYLANASALAPYFRTLYRIFDLIETANIPEREKVRYAKIVRAQLSENELLLLRYNCNTIYGKKFIEYINKYRVLKHLPLLSIPEFANITRLLSTEDALYRFSLNMILFDIIKKTYDIAVGNITMPNDAITIAQTGRYTLDLNFIRTNNLSLTITINNSIQNRHPILKSFKNFRPSDFRYLIEILLKEILIYSNFSQYQKSDSIEISTRIFASDQTIKIIGIAFSPTNFRLSHPSRDSVYGIAP